MYEVANAQIIHAETYAEPFQKSKMELIASSEYASTWNSESE